MQQLTRVLLTIILAASFALPLNPHTVSRVDAAPVSADFAPGEILVKFNPGTPGRAIADAHRQLGGQALEVLSGIDVHVVRVAAGQETGRVAAYARNPNVLYAEVNYLYHATGIFNDPMGGQQWQFDNTGQTGGKAGADIRAVSAWAVTTGAASVPIAILDTGIDQTHEDLASKIAKKVNFTTSATVEDKYGHGTHVAGSAAAITDNALGVAGTCPKCGLYNVKVLSDSGSGSTSWIANGIIWATDNGAKVISMSLGGTAGSSAMQSAVNYAWSKGVILTAAAGNSGSSAPSYPAYYANVIAVAATDKNDAKASFSNYGSWVNVAAPGASILSTAPDHSNTIWGTGVKYGSISGTSMATPHVAGVAGLVWSSGVCAVTDNACVRARIQDGADRIAGSGTYWISGRINAYKSVAGAPTNAAPMASIVAPLTGQSVSGTIPVTVTASDSDGTVAKVELGVDGAFSDITAGRDAANPATYRFSWDTTALGDGAHRLDARVTDDKGATGAAAAVTVNVTNAPVVDAPPTATISGPSNGSTVRGTVTIQVRAADDKGVTSVAYAIDGGAYAPLAYNAGNGHWEASWNTTGVVDGSHAIDARATDTAGQSGQAARVSITVANAVKSLAVTAATDRSTYHRLDTVRMIMAVTDAAAQPVAGAAVRVDVYAPNGSRYATGTGTTRSSGRIAFGMRLPSTASLGTYRIVATATKSGYASGQGTAVFTVE